MKNSKRVTCLLQIALASSVTLLSTVAFSWQISLEADKENKVQHVVVTNDRDLKELDAYLVFFDQDATLPEDKFLSWTVERGWQRNLHPVSDQPLDLRPFGPKKITTLDKVCPEGHRCFLALVAVKPGDDPLAVEWQASSLLPLTLAAGRERLPGQQFFLPTGDSRATSGNGSLTADDGDVAISEESAAAPPLAEPAKDATPNSTAGVAVTTEKPDIFRLIGNEVLYANSQAQRFQIIDVSNPEKPSLTGSTELKDSPRELYVMGDYYILLQTNNYVGEEGTHLTVLTKGANGSLTATQELTLPGYFRESRRRDDFIYAVTEQSGFVSVEGNTEEIACAPDADCGYSGGYYQMSLFVDALRLTSNGQLEKVDATQLTGYDAKIAIFPDYLVIANADPQKWPDSQVQAFDLSQGSDPLVELPALQVPGRIPSEFHLNVQNQQLRVVYGPAEVGKDGSTLAIYDLTTQKPTLLGQVGKIAPGEDLFATRFADNLAYVITYERKDPLWVIDLSDAQAPKIVGELEVPGWSEKMFFHDNKLFAVGIHDQPEPNEGEKWVRRVAVSLFDVSNPTKPDILSRFIPLVDKVSYSWSPALDDERALLLNWENEFAALPIQSWDTTSVNFLQVVSFDNNKFKDAGLVESPVSLQRSVSINADTLAALGDQALLTVKWGNNQAKVLAELELATNLMWLKSQENGLWAAAMGDSGYHRLYHYAPPELEKPTHHWNLPRGYNGVSVDKDLAVFYNYNPLTIQVVETTGEGKVRAAQNLEVVKPARPTLAGDEKPVSVDRKESSAASEESATVTEPAIVPMEEPYFWYYRTTALLRDGWFYITEQQPLAETNYPSFIKIPESYWQPQWLLRSWQITTENAKEAPARSIPGEPVNFVASGKLVTKEYTANGQLQLNLLELLPDSAKLLSSYQVPCNNYSGQVLISGNMLYTSCVSEINYLVPPADTDPRESTTILKLNPEQSFVEEGRWSITGYQQLQAANGDTVLISTGGRWWWYGPLRGEIMDDVAVRDKMAMMPPYYQSRCDIYRLTPESNPVVLKHLETCPMTEGVALSSQQAWIANGFAGIERVSW